MFALFFAHVRPRRVEADFRAMTILLDVIRSRHEADDGTTARRFYRGEKPTDKSEISVYEALAVSEHEETPDIRGSPWKRVLLSFLSPAVLGYTDRGNKFRRLALYRCVSFQFCTIRDAQTSIFVFLRVNRRLASRSGTNKSLRVPHPTPRTSTSHTRTYTRGSRPRRYLTSWSGVSNVLVDNRLR